MDAGGRATQEQLPRKLYTKAKQEPGYRFYALYDKVYRADLLQHAYNLVSLKKGAPGIDGVSFEIIEAEEGIETFLEGPLCQDSCRPKQFIERDTNRGW